MVEFTDYIIDTLKQFKKRIKNPETINTKGDLFMIKMALIKYKDISRQIKNVQSTLDELVWTMDDERRNDE